MIMTWTPERRRRQAEVMKLVRSVYFSDEKNTKAWHEKNSEANRIAGKNRAGIKTPESSHVAWNKGLTKETSLTVMESAAARSKPRSESSKINVKNGCAKRGPEWYANVCANNKVMAIAKKGVPRSIEFMRKLLNAKKPTSIEIQFMNLIRKNNLPYKYVGDGEFWIGNKNPDFIHTDKSERKVIELYGDYWHRGHNPQDRIDLFAKSNFVCTVIWEREFKRADWEERVLELLHV